MTTGWVSCYLIQILSRGGPLGEGATKGAKAFYPGEPLGKTWEDVESSHKP